MSSLLALVPSSPPATAAWPPGFMPLDLRLAEGFPSPTDNRQGTFSFLSERRDLGYPIDWHPTDVSRLWMYHLHYFEWAWSFAAAAQGRDPSAAECARDDFAELWRSWTKTVPFGKGDPWSPYVASLRAWALCGVHKPLVAGTGIEPAVVSSLARHARFLRLHVEHDVGGNHLVKNLKALIGLGVFLGDESLVQFGAAQLRRQLAVQVLDDGGHYERSPSYHCQVLGDLVDIASLLTAGGHQPIVGLGEAIASMRRWLGLMTMPHGDVPLFNDSVSVGAARLALLEPGPASTARLTVLRQSGYVVIRADQRTHLVADVGVPGPKELPAHIHADCLSFELCVDGTRSVVDTGTSTYEPGARRALERSTAAHNTVSVDGADQSEVWGTFRAARLARATLEEAVDDGSTVRVVASHDGYARLPGSPVHRRTWTVVPGRVAIADEIVGRGEHRVESHLHLQPGTAQCVTWSGPPGLRTRTRPATYATGFGCFHESEVASAEWVGPLPARLRAELRFAEAAAQRLDVAKNGQSPRAAATGQEHNVSPTP